MGSLYRSQHELILVFKNGRGRHRNNVELGRHGRNRTNVWQYASVNDFGRPGEEGHLAITHPTVKPVGLIADAIVDSSARGDIVLDPFIGSGSTLIAAERVGRVCRGMELDPLYVDTAIRRWQRYAGGTAVHANTGFRQLDISRGRRCLNQTKPITTLVMPDLPANRSSRPEDRATLVAGQSPPRTSPQR
jgi:hypothetical protein